MVSELRFFVSYAGRDRAWAEWMAWHLRDAGHAVELDMWDWSAGDNVVERMNDALVGATRVVAVLSEAYFERERFTTTEWTAVLSDRSEAGRARLVPVRIEPVELPPLWRPLAYVDLFGLAETLARKVLLAAVDGPTRPTTSPGFPGGPTSVCAGPRVPGSLPVVWNVPPPSAVFTGRDDLLVRLRESLTTGRPAVVHALHGLGGVGKTLLAVEYAHRFAGEYELVWWVNAEQPKLVGEQLAELAVAAGAVTSGVDTSVAVQAVRAHLRGRDRWLVVFDNAPATEDMIEWMPQGPGHVVLTSRSQGWGSVAVAVPVDVFDRAESVTLLTRQVAGLTELDADRLAQRLGDLPLALVQAAGVMTETGMPTPEYVSELDLTAGAVLAAGKPVGYPVSLAASVRVSASRLAQEDPAAGHLLRLCSLLAPEPIPLWLFTAETVGVPAAPLDAVATSRWVLRQCVGRAARYGLLQAREDTVVMHRLTQAVVRDDLTPYERAAVGSEVEALLVAAQPDGDAPATWPRWAQLLPHLLTTDPASSTNADLRRLITASAWYLHARGDAAIALPHAEHFYQQWRLRLGEDDPDTLQVAHTLACCLYQLGRYDQAHRLHEDLLTQRRRILGDDHPDTLTTAVHVASALYQLGDNERAQRLDEDTLTRCRRVFGDDHPTTLGAATSLARDLGMLGQYERARRLNEDTVASYRQVLGNDHPATLRAANNLAFVLRQMGQHEQAHHIDEDTLTRRRRVLGDDHPDTLHSANNVGRDLFLLDRYEQARRMDEDTLTRRQRVLGDDHPATVLSASNLAADLTRLEHSGQTRTNSAEVGLIPEER